MLAKMLEKEIKRFYRLFEQDADGTVNDLGETPEVVLDDEGNNEDAGEIATEIDNIVDKPYREDFIDKLSEALGEDWTIDISDDEDDNPDTITATIDGKKLTMNIIIDLGEPLAIFSTGDTKLTLSLYPIFQKEFVDEGQVYEELVNDDEALGVFIDGFKEVADELLGVQVEEEEPGEPENIDGTDNDVIDTDIENDENTAEVPDTAESRRIKAAHLRRIKEKRLKKMKEDDNFVGNTDPNIDNVDLNQYAKDNRETKNTPFNVVHVADDEVKYSKVEPEIKPADIASKAFDNMVTLDPNKKVTQGPDAYPNLYGFVTEPVNN